MADVTLALVHLAIFLALALVHLAIFLALALFIWRSRFILLIEPVVGNVFSSQRGLRVGHDGRDVVGRPAIVVDLAVVHLAITVPFMPRAAWPGTVHT